MTSVTLTFDLQPWPFAWTSLLSLAITPESFVMIRWGEHNLKGVTDSQIDRQTDQALSQQIKTVHTGLILGLRPANETTLLCNDVSHWLGANLESALFVYHRTSKCAQNDNVAHEQHQATLRPNKNTGEMDASMPLSGQCLIICLIWGFLFTSNVSKGVKEVFHRMYC